MTSKRRSLINLLSLSYLSKTISKSLLIKTLNFADQTLHTPTLVCEIEFRQRCKGQYSIQSLSGLFARKILYSQVC